MAGLNPVFCYRYSTQECVIRKTVPSEALMGCEALETKVSRVQMDGNESARDVATASTRRLGARVAWYG